MIIIQHNAETYDMFNQKGPGGKQTVSPLAGKWKLELKHLLTSSFTILCVAFTSATAAADEVVHVRLLDRLDRPGDGYCFDILGTGRNLRLDLPLFAHNCKDGATTDSAVIYNSQRQLVFLAPNVCVTVFGVNKTVLPGTTILLRPCNEQTPFFDTPTLQKFDHTDKGQLKLRGSELCVAVGTESSVTYSPRDRWRVLSMEICTDIDPSHSVWEMVAPE